MDIRERYIQRLLTRFPPSLSVCYLLHSLNEATELALRLARAHRPGKDIIVLEDVDYGMTTSLANMSPGRRKFWVHAATRTDAATVAGKAHLIQASGRGLCGFFAKGVFPHGYLRDAYTSVSAAGGLNVAIEELDPASWEFAQHGVEPDVVVIGDSLGGGFPMAAVITRPTLAAPFPANTGGSDAACAAGLAVLDALGGTK